MLANISPDTVISLDMLERFGLPVSLLLLVIWGCARAAKWFAPRIDRMIERHEQLLDTLEEEMGSHRVILTKLEENQIYVLEFLKALNEQLVKGKKRGKVV